MKIDLSKYNDSRLTGGLELANAIEAKGYEAYMVGGCVRDMVRQQFNQVDEADIHDIDLATSMPIEELQKHFGTASNNGEAHGTILVFWNGVPYEVTHFRTDGNYSDGRHPDEISLTESFEEDTSRRDFTINAMGLKWDGTVIDYHDGINDIKNKIIRAVGEPTKRFAEDALRMVRCVRFKVNFDYAYDDSTLHAIGANAFRLKSVSNERIRAEFLKLCDMSKLMTFIDHLSWCGLTDNMAAFRNIHIPELRTYVDDNAVKITKENMFAIATYLGDESNIDSFVPTRDEKRVWKYYHKYKGVYSLKPSPDRYWTALVDFASGDCDNILAMEDIGRVEYPDWVDDVPVAKFITKNMPDTKIINQRVMSMGITGKEFGNKAAELLEEEYKRIAATFPKSILMRIGNSYVEYIVNNIK